MSYLEIILRNDRNAQHETKFSTPDPRLLAYRFREAKYHFSTHSDTDPRIRHLSFIKEYQFKELKDAVLARRVTPPATEVKEVQEVPAVELPAAPIIPVIIDTVQDVIMYVIEHKQEPRLAFVFRAGPIVNEAKLERWCAANHYTIQYSKDRLNLILRKSI